VKIEEADVGRKAPIKAIADFMKAVLSETTLTQKVPLPKIESSAQTTNSSHTAFAFAFSASPNSL
jgi:hypothetical protein